jgi:protein-S-isoprenylcysteine O-methyltransferase Ste14
MVLNSFIGLGFSLLLFSELLEMRGTKASRAVRGLGYGLVALALLFFAYPAAAAISQAADAPERSIAFLRERPAQFYLLLALSLAFAAMLFWTVFLELALGKRKFRLGKRDVFSRGSYGVCRHPGFWWLVLYLLPLGIIRGFSTTIFTILLVVFLNFLLVSIQDLYSFPRFFKDYEAYRKKVPFLIPKFIKKGIRRS